MALAMNESNGPVLEDLFVFASASGSTGALLAAAALPATLLAATATLLAAAALSATGTVAALLAAAALSATGTVAALLAAAALPAALIALGNQFVQVIVSIIECVSAIPNLWSFHGVFLFAEESSAYGRCARSAAELSGYCPLDLSVRADARSFVLTKTALLTDIAAMAPVLQASHRPHRTRGEANGEDA
jgi:hypothetical protein